jgi:dienelactone hydrolase
MKVLRPLLLVALALGARASDVSELLEHPLLDPHLPLEEVQTYADVRVAAMPKMKTLAEWQRYAAELRAKVLDQIVFRGAAAKEWRNTKTKVERLETIAGGPGYHIVKLRYEALPGMWIPALLYEPEKIEGKIPVHLAVNGHEKEGKSASYIQLRCINLAKRGIATLNPEWFAKGQMSHGGFLHEQMNQLDLCGVSGLAPFYLEMSRGLDLLLALPYADPKRVAVSGLSGGGWQTITISALDPRVTFCNPVAGYSSVHTRAHFPRDLGDSEQAPCDLATIADYTHLTALLAGRGALLTFNEADDCCFAAPHALVPLLEAAEPIFALYGQSGRLRNHVNYEPGTHNFLRENREAFYAALGEEFYPGEARFSAKEIPSEAELKTAAQLEVPMPEGNLTFNELALGLSKDLPRAGAATREKLAALVHYKAESLVAESEGTETRGETRATFWKLHIGGAWTVPAVELSRGEPKGTTLLIADKGRESAATEAESLLGEGERVIALDPYYFGESKIEGRDYFLDMLLDTVGERALGLQARQVAAAARWAVEQSSQGPVQVVAIGPRTSTFALLATALEPKAISQLHREQALTSLRQVLEKDWNAYQTPELFCFGLLEYFDIPQIEALAGPARLK